MIYSHTDYENDPFLAVPDISQNLTEGRLLLFLGAGVSKGFGLPDWPELVARLLREESESHLQELRGKSSKDLARCVDEIDDGSARYLQTVHEALYRETPNDAYERHRDSPLLTAVAALLSGSCRGRIDTVVTYNFDDMLEQYLAMLGYRVCVRKTFTDIADWADVVVNHPHGYLPQHADRDELDTKLVFSDKSFRERRAEIDGGWENYVQNILYRKDVLFLGLSGDDGTMLDVIQRARKRIERADDYIGYWVMNTEAYQRNAKRILDVGVCPIPVANEELPRFVFSICQEAGKLPD